MFGKPSHARATASHGCILDTDDIRVFIERQEMSRGNEADSNWKYFTQVARREHCVENCMAPSSQMDCIWSEGAEFFHECCAGVPATLTFQMREVRAWFIYSRWSWWEIGIYWCMCGSGKEWLCSSDWITILRADKLGIGGHSEASESEYWTRAVFHLISADKRAIASKSIKVGRVRQDDQKKTLKPMPKYRPEKKAVPQDWRLRAYP